MRLSVIPLHAVRWLAAGELWAEPVSRVFSDLLAVVGPAVSALSGTEPVDGRGIAPARITSSRVSQRNASATSSARKRTQSQRSTERRESGESAEPGSVLAHGTGSLATTAARVYEQGFARSKFLGERNVGMV